MALLSQQLTVLLVKENIPDPNLFLTGYLDSESWAIRNYAFYDGVDDLLEMSRTEYDWEKREKILVDIQIKAMTDMPLLPLHNNWYWWITTNDVVDFVLEPFWYTRFNYVDVER